MIIFQGRIFDNANEINLTNGVVDLYMEKGGSFFTCIPISGEDFRKEYKTNYAVKRRLGFIFVEYANIDDWGTAHHIAIEKKHYGIIDALEKNRLYKKEK